MLGGFQQGFVAYLEIHLCGWARDGVYEAKARRPREVPAALTDDIQPSRLTQSQ